MLLRNALTAAALALLSTGPVLADCAAKRQATITCAPGTVYDATSDTCVAEVTG